MFVSETKQAVEKIKINEIGEGDEGVEVGDTCLVHNIGAKGGEKAGEEDGGKAKKGGDGDNG